MTELFNASVQLFLGLLIAWAVMSHHVDDGVIVKIGLSFISIGFLASVMLAIEPASLHALARASACVHFGMLICAVGYAYRVRKAHRKPRRASDFMNLRGHHGDHA